VRLPPSAVPVLGPRAHQLLSCCPVRLAKDRAHGCCDHRLVALRSPDQEGAHEMDSTPLPGGASQNGLHRFPQAIVGAELAASSGTLLVDLSRLYNDLRAELIGNGT
jgi:hypothetical protein